MTADLNHPDKKARLIAILRDHPLVIRAICEVESAYNPDAVSPAGARGAMQIMPFWDDKLGITDPFDPDQSVRAGAYIFEDELKRFRDQKLALAAYNAGAPRVLAAIKKAESSEWEAIKEHLPEETQNYVPKVLAVLKRFDEQGV